MSLTTAHVPPVRMRPIAVKAAADNHHAAALPVSEELIAKRAYTKFVARGGAHGQDREDWFAAANELQAESYRH